MKRNEKPKSAITIAELYRALYNVCRVLLPTQSQKDPDAVRALRDHLTNERYDKVYTEMTKEELDELIADLKTKESKRPTQMMMRQLNFYMIAVGLVYCNMNNWEYIDENSCVVLRGEDLRKMLVRQFYEGRRRLPQNIIRRLFSEWINPKSNDFLKEGKYKKKVINPERLHYEKLSIGEVRYLISRYYLIYDNKINKTQQPVQAQLN